MKLLLIFLSLVGLEVGIRQWRQATPVSRAPLLSLPMARAAMANPGKFQRAIDTYRADRGAELSIEGGAGESLTVFYFEWDQVEASPLMDIAGHSPEECNVAAGFRLVNRQAPRSFAASGQEPLIFDVTTFAHPAGRQIHIFKGAWIQGLGSWDIRQGQNREARLKKAFSTGRGAARVLQAGIEGAGSVDEAWQSFQTEVLDHLASSPGFPPPSP